MAKKSKAKKATVRKGKKKATLRKAEAKKATAKKRAAAQTQRQPLARVGEPIAPSMCFRTADDNVFIKFDWNPVAKRYNLNRRRATRSECQE